MNLFRKAGRPIVRSLIKDRDFKNQVKVKLTKLGAKGKEEPLFCEHEHCRWWQLKHYIIKEKEKQRRIRKLNEINKKKKEEEDEE